MSRRTRHLPWFRCAPVTLEQLHSIARLALDAGAGTYELVWEHRPRHAWSTESTPALERARLRDEWEQTKAIYDKGPGFNLEAGWPPMESAS